MPLVPFNGVTPQITPTTFLAPDAWLTGEVTLADDTSILFGAVMRGDIFPIAVGARSNVQEHAVLHTSHGLGPCRVGADVTVGHRAILHGCSVADRCIIGMGAIILDNAEIGPDCIIGAHSLITMGTKIPARSMVFGSPAKVIRQLTDPELQSIIESAESYRRVGGEYRKYFASL